MTLLVGIGKQLLHVLWVEGVEDIEEVTSVGQLLFLGFIWKEGHEVSLFMHEGPQFFD